MKSSSFFKLISHLNSKNLKIMEYILFKVSHFLVAGNIILFFGSCERDRIFSSSRFDIDLLSSTVWGWESLACNDYNSEEYSSIFSPGGQYIEYYRIYQFTYGGTWSLKDNETLIICNDKYKILKLTENILEIRYNEWFSCISKFRALPNTKAITVGVTAVSKTSAKLHGFVRTCTLTNVSFEYGTSTAYGAIVTPDNNPLTGPTNKIVNVTLSGLVPETVYHYRIRAANSSGTYYGQDQTFRTFNTATLSDADNNVYNTVTIGSQVWMTENLKTTKYNDNSTIPLVTDEAVWAKLSTPGYCWYKNDSATYKAANGALYNWYTVNTGKLCPTGWHVPSSQEWTILEQYLGQEAGSKLTEGGYDYAYPRLYSDPLSRLEASNESGFSALFSAMRNENSNFYTSYCQLWSRTEDNLQSAWLVFISNGGVRLLLLDKKNGLPVRCLKD